ncbi:MAG: hypothetical protein GWP91_04320, partial [Rhodobacterales bacterium]|nr:hypothetical protein [Rhodobacterales bacterium]
MAEDLNLIRRFITALVARERRLIVATAILRLAALWALLVLCSVFAVSQGWDRSAILMLLVGVGGVGAWAWIWVPVLMGWRPAGNALRQARLVEHLDPDLRGRLVTAVERVDGAPPGESEALVALVARRAAKRVALVAPSAVLPASGAQRAGLLAVLAWIVVVPAMFMAPGGAPGLFRWWAAGFDAQAAIADAEVHVEE